MPEEDLFGNLEEDERPALRSVASSIRLRGNRSRGRTPGPGPVPSTNTLSPPMSPTSPTRTRARGTPDVSPMMRPMTISTANLLEPGQSGEAPSLGKVSPLTRLFKGESPIRGRVTSMGGGANLKKVETLLEDIKHLPVNKFTEEMRELQVMFIRLLTFFVNVPYPLSAFGGFIHYPLTILPSDFVRTSYSPARHCPSSFSDPPRFCYI